MPNKNTHHFKPLIFDAHLDLSMNAMEWNRDLRLPVDDIRAREAGLTDKPDRAKGMVSFPALREGNIGVVVATQIARYVKEGSQLPGWNSPEQAWAQTQGQLAWYKAMEEEEEVIQLTTSAELKNHLDLWNDSAVAAVDKPIGFFLSLEGADSLVNVRYLERAYKSGLRMLGPAHYGPGRYAYGTDATGSLGVQGRELLKEMDALGMILDVTHLCDECFWEALEKFKGPVWASHHNCRALVDHNRQLSDDMIRALIERNAVIGGALDAWMMVPNWKRGESQPRQMNCSLNTLVEHFDHICQLAGNANHIGLGTDLDGAFGKEQAPFDLDTIADLQLLPAILETRGYNSADVTRVLSGNFIDFLLRNLPSESGRHK